MVRDVRLELLALQLAFGQALRDMPGAASECNTCTGFHTTPVGSIRRLHP